MKDKILCRFRVMRIILSPLENCIYMMQAINEMAKV